MHYRKIRRGLAVIVAIWGVGCGDTGSNTDDTGSDVVIDTDSADTGGLDTVDAPPDSDAEDTDDTGRDADTGADTSADTDTGSDAADIDTGSDTSADTDTGSDTGDACDADVLDLCTELGATECADGATVRECVDLDGCNVWQTSDCDPDVCADGACVDICETRATCPSAAWCDADDAVTCTTDDDGCLVESDRVACGFGCTDGSCDENPCSAAPCVVGEDEPYCDGHAFVSCAFDADASCHHWTTVDCSSTDGFTCIDNGFDIGCDENPCGDGFADGFVGEECDDGNDEDGDGCSSTCTIEEDAICITGAGGTSVCQVPDCGDGVVQFDESCDDGGGGVGCTDTCAVDDGYDCEGSPSVCAIVDCGDESISRGEGCDDGNTTDADGCSAACGSEVSPIPGSTLSFAGALEYGDPLFARPQTSCGSLAAGSYLYDHVRIANPTDVTVTIDVDVVFADDGAAFLFGGAFDPTSPVATCVSGSSTHPRFGANGAKLTAVDLAPGAEYVLLVTTSDRRLPIGGYTIDVLTRGCGDAIIVAGETCDDGNVDDGDGCDSDCGVTDGWACIDTPSYCHVPGCGGGLVEDGEDCDDGNDVAGDGCTACSVDSGAECVGDRPSVCRFPGCGDGFLDDGEACDDGNEDSGDGCSDACAVESGWNCDGEPSTCVEIVCGNGVVSAPFESCDDGNETDGDGCSSSCFIEIAAAGSTLEISGTSEGSDPAFVRANETCGTSSAFVFYDQYTVENPTDGPLVLTVTAAWTGDGFLHVYDSFDGGSPTDGCLDGSAADGGTSEVSATVAGGGTLTIVVSSIGSFSVHGDYTLTLSSATL